MAAVPSLKSLPNRSENEDSDESPRDYEELSRKKRPKLGDGEEGASRRKNRFVHQRPSSPSATDVTAGTYDSAALNSVQYGDNTIQYEAATIVLDQVLPRESQDDYLDVGMSSSAHSAPRRRIGSASEIDDNSRAGAPSGAAPGAAVAGEKNDLLMSQLLDTVRSHSRISAASSRAESDGASSTHEAGRNVISKDQAAASELEAMLDEFIPLETVAPKGRQRQRSGFSNDSRPDQPIATSTAAHVQLPLPPWTSQPYNKGHWRYAFP